MKRFFYLLTLACWPILATAQQFAGADEHKWEVGFDVLPFVYTSFHLKESVLFKYRPNDRYKYRLRLGFAVDKVNGESPFEPNLDTLGITQPTFYVAMGAERRLLSSRRVYIGCGIDAFLFYSFRDGKDIQYVGNPPARRRTIIEDKEIRAGGNLLLNCEYLLTDNLSIGVESFWQFAYHYVKRSEEFFGNQPTSFARGGALIYRFSSQIQPFSAINFTFKF